MCRARWRAGSCRRPTRNPARSGTGHTNLHSRCHRRLSHCNPGRTRPRTRRNSRKERDGTCPWPRRRSPGCRAARRHMGPARAGRTGRSGPPLQKRSSTTHPCAPSLASACEPPDASADASIPPSVGLPGGLAEARVSSEQLDAPRRARTKPTQASDLILDIGANHTRTWQSRLWCAPGVGQVVAAFALVTGRSPNLVLAADASSCFLLARICSTFRGDAASRGRRCVCGRRQLGAGSVRCSQRGRLLFRGACRVGHARSQRTERVTARRSDGITSSGTAPAS